MTDQPNKTKQQLLTELESIMSMLDDDAVIPTLDTVVEPTQTSAAVAETSATATESNATATQKDAPTPQEDAITASKEMAAEIAPPSSDDGQRQLLNVELDKELREAMEIDIAIPDVPVPNSESLFGASEDKPQAPSSSPTQAEEATPLEDTSNLTLEAGFNTLGEPSEAPTSNTPAEPQDDDSAHSSTTEPGRLKQQNPFPAPTRKPHLFNGESEAQAPLPGQQQLFSAEHPPKKDQAPETTKSRLENPFKNNSAVRAAQSAPYPPASIINTLRKAESHSAEASARHQAKDIQAQKPQDERQQDDAATELEQQSLASSDSSLNSKLDNSKVLQPASSPALSSAELEYMIDEVVKEHLPKLEEALRSRLMAELASKLSS